MSAAKYPLRSGRNLLSYRFESQGPKGTIPKLIQFTLLNSYGFYNLAFGDEDPTTGELNDLAISDNGDLEQVLATVVEAIRNFINTHPTAIIYFSGSSHSRTRLYRMAIGKYFIELAADFEILGLVDQSWYDFEKDKNYEAFLARAKSV